MAPPLSYEQTHSLRTKQATWPLAAALHEGGGSAATATLAKPPKISGAISHRIGLRIFGRPVLRNPAPDIRPIA